MLSNISMWNDRGMSENCDSTWAVVKMQPRDARWSLLALSLYIYALLFCTCHRIPLWNLLLITVALFCNFYTFSFLTPIIERPGYYCLSQTFRDSHKVQLIDKCLYISLMISHVFYLSVRIVITLMICLTEICYH